MKKNICDFLEIFLPTLPAFEYFSLLSQARLTDGF